jgi:GDP-6-deoxy-D-talose 4-dehydrogenase
MKKILITGAAGFTGRYVAQEFTSAGYDVHGLVTQLDAAASPQGFHPVTGNLLERESIGAALAAMQPDMVVHLAGIAFVAHSDVAEMYLTNVVGTRNLLDALDRMVVPPRTLIASSANIYGNEQQSPITEDAVPAPANDYGVSKLAMEYVAKLYGSRIPLIVARPFNYTGRGQNAMFLIPKIVQHVRERRAIIELGNIDVARDFNDVRNVAYAYRRLLENPQAAGQTVNICSGHSYTLREVLRMAQEIGHHSRMEIRINPAFVREKEVKYLEGSTALLRKLAGDLRDVPLRDTLDWMIHAHRE